MTACPHGMPSPASCVDCMADGPVRTPSTWHAARRSFPAAYIGTCPACGDDFAVADRIRQWSFGPSYGSPERTVYTHAGCPAPPR